MAMTNEELLRKQLAEITQALERTVSELHDSQMKNQQLRVKINLLETDLETYRTKEAAERQEKIDSGQLTEIGGW